MLMQLPGLIRMRLGSVRVRLTVMSVAVVGVALVAGAASVLAVLRATITEDVRNAASLRATQIVASIAETGGVVPTFATKDGELIQVQDASGAVLGASPELAGGSVLPAPGPGNYLVRDDLVDGEELDRSDAERLQVGDRRLGRQPCIGAAEILTHFRMELREALDVHFVDDRVRVAVPPLRAVMPRE